MTRSHTKHRTLADVIRRQIVSGKYKPGAQLPPRTDFERRFQASMPTVQKALDLLSDDGFIRSRQGAGTYVTDHPPHLHHYGVVIPRRPNLSRLYDAMRLAFGALHPDPHTRVTEYDWDDATGSRLLQADVLAHRLAGLIFVHVMPGVMSTPAITQRGIPRVFLQSGFVPGVPVIHVDMGRFYELAVERLVKRGRRRIAVIGVQPFAENLSGLERFRASIARHGLPIKPYWMAPIDRALTDDVVRYITRVLLELEGEKRPDALIICDENLVEPASAAIMAAGVRVPDDLDVVAHASFPLSAAASTLTIDRIGFDCRQVLREAMRMLDAQRSGKKPADLTLPAITESELL